MIKKGIDVSKWQGTIDWLKVKNSGVTFAILRIGYGRYDNQKDPQFERNYEQAINNGISVSVRTIKVPDLILEELSNRREIVEINKRLLKDKYIDNDYISCQENGKGHCLSSLNSYLSKVCNDLCLPHITVHSLRHMCATILLENASTSVGENLAKISAFLGHRSIHTTFKYYCEVMDDNNKILSFMNSFLLETSNA